MSDDLRGAYKARFAGDLAPERYELVAWLDSLTPDRRDFLRTLGGGLLFVVQVQAQGTTVPVRVQVTDDGRYRAFTGKMEMGQGARTLLTQAFAEELGVPVEHVSLVMGDTQLCPDDGGTWASLTTPQTVPVIRQAAAAVRAARTGQAAAITPPGRWSTLGTSLANVDGRAIVTGAKVYPSDVRMPGLLHAAIVRSPAHTATLQSVDTASAEAVRGVRVIRDGDLLAVLASDPITARIARERVTATWSTKPITAQQEWPALYRRTAEAPTEQPEARYPPLLRRGDAEAALAASPASRRRSSTYGIAPIAHVPLEPRAAVAVWDGTTMTVHSGTQAPFLVRQEVARALKLPEAQVRIIVHDAGGAFGGKQRGECDVEAARLARLSGAPVRVAWTREEEFTCSYTRPAGVIDVESAVDAQGRLTALRFANYNSGASGLTPPYDIPNHWIGFFRARSDVRQGSYRALAAVANTFARESHMDEWADGLGVDPVEFRLRHITDARLREVLTRTAARFGWAAATATARRGVGVSCTLEKDARLALCVEIEVTGGDVRVQRLVATGDFGAALNPDALHNLMTGAILQGLGGALWEQVDFDPVSQRTRRLAEYRVPRFRDLPRLDIEIVDRRDVPSAGAGESPIVLPAPALAAAIFRATGQRRRDLPLASG